MGANELIGTWHLVTAELRSADGDVSYPFGPDAVARLIYTEDGNVSYHIARAERRRFAGGDLLTGTTEEKVAAAESYQSYCGTYEVKGNVLIHHVDVSSFPNWVGTAQVRDYALEGGRLILSSAPFLAQGKLQSARLIWRRARENS